MMIRNDQPISSPMVPGSRVLIELIQKASKKFRFKSPSGLILKMIRITVKKNTIKKDTTHKRNIEASEPLDIILSKLYLNLFQRLLVVFIKCRLGDYERFVNLIYFMDT